MPPSPNIRLAIAQYIRAGKSGHHWALVAALPNTKETRVFQIIGNIDTYGYETTGVISITKSKLLRGGYEVGEVLGPPSMVDNPNIQWLEAHLATAVTIVRHDEAWNCQTWVVEVVRELQDHPEKVVMHRPFDLQKVRDELYKEREEVWEEGNETYFERIEKGLQ